MAVPLPESAGALGARRGRRRRIPWIFLGVIGIVGAVGIVLLLISLFTAFFGLRSFAVGFPYGGGLFGAFLILWAVLLGLWIALRRSWRSEPRESGVPGGRNPALFIGHRRYASGEATRGQYDQIVQHPGRPLRAP